jgi:MFS family permease
MKLPWPRPGGDVASPEPGKAAGPCPDAVRAGRLDSTFRAFRHRNYRLYYFGQSISLSGTWMQLIAQAWLVLELTDSQTALGIVTMLQFLPVTVFVLFAGVIADRVPKRSFIIGTQMVAMVQALLLAGLVMTDAVQVWHIYVLALMLGFANAFDQPARQAFVIEMVGKEDLLNAVALNSGIFNGARLAGPSIGGVVIAVAGLEVAFLINAVSFIPVIAALMLMDRSQLKSASVPRTGRIDALGELREGVGFALRTPATRLIIILIAMLGTFGYNFLVVLPLLARYVLDGGSEVLGFLTATVGLGAFISALLLAGQKSATRSMLFLGAAVFTAMLAGLAVSEWLWVTIPLLFVLGLANTAFAATANTSLQIATPDHLRGRVMSLWMLLVAGSTPIGAFLTGFLAERIGVRETIALNAAACLIGVLAAAAYYLSHQRDVERTADAARLAPATPAGEGV